MHAQEGHANSAQKGIQINLLIEQVISNNKKAGHCSAERLYGWRLYNRQKFTYSHHGREHHGHVGLSMIP